MTDHQNFQLVNSSSETKEYNTLDLENLDIDLSSTQEVKLSRDLEKPKIKEIENTKLTQEPQTVKKHYDTLKEPVIDTLKRDIKGILTKATFVLNPYIGDEDKKKSLRDWDLWGPLVLTILLACSLAIGITNKDTLFVEVFTIFWLGGAIVTLNAKVLGADCSIFQIICLLGYCMFPLDVTAVTFKLIIDTHDFIKLILVIAACSWSIFSSTRFIQTLITEEKKLLVLYPVALFYIFLAFFVLMNHKV